MFLMSNMLIVVIVFVVLMSWWMKGIWYGVVLVWVICFFEGMKLLVWGNGFIVVGVEGSLIL